MNQVFQKTSPEDLREVILVQFLLEPSSTNNLRFGDCAPTQAQLYQLTCGFINFNHVVDYDANNIVAHVVDARQQENWLKSNNENQQVREINGSNPLVEITTSISLPPTPKQIDIKTVKVHYFNGTFKHVNINIGDFHRHYCEWLTKKNLAM
jgi:hypothetical protein